MNNTMTKAEIEEFVTKVMEVRLQQAVETFVQNNEIKLKELSLVERVVRVEEELKYLRQMFEVKFDAVEKHFEIINKRFEAVDKRFETVDKHFETVEKHFETVDKHFEIINKRFEAVDKRFETVDKRFESLQREMNARFEAMDKRFEAVDKRFSVVQWMIGIFVGIPALIIALTNVIQFIKS